MRTAILALAAGLALPPALSAQSPSEIADGSRVWADNCTRCHNARPSQERTDAQWRTIVLHMRARANLTRTEARLVTTFLQATNLPETAVAGSPPAPAVPPPSDAQEEGRGEDCLPPLRAALLRYLRTLDGP